MRDDRGSSIQSDSGVYAALADYIFPHGLAGPDFDRVNCAIAATGHEQARTIDIRYDGR